MLIYRKSLMIGPIRPEITSSEIRSCLGYHDNAYYYLFYERLENIYLE